jgi:hypothetical protein
MADTTPRVGSKVHQSYLQHGQQLSRAWVKWQVATP